MKILDQVENKCVNIKLVEKLSVLSDIGLELCPLCGEPLPIDTIVSCRRTECMERLGIIRLSYIIKRLRTEPYVAGDYITLDLKELTGEDS